MSSSRTVTASSSGGISFMSLLFLVFLVLKLTGTIAWSWWWVTAPLWGPLAVLLAIVLVVLVICGIIMGGIALFEASQRNANREKNEGLFPKTAE